MDRGDLLRLRPAAAGGPELGGQVVASVLQGIGQPAVEDHASSPRAARADRR